MSKHFVRRTIPLDTFSLTLFLAFYFPEVCIFLVAGTETNRPGLFQGQSRHSPWRYCSFQGWCICPYSCFQLQVCWNHTLFVFSFPQEKYNEVAEKIDSFNFGEDAATTWPHLNLLSPKKTLILVLLNHWVSIPSVSPSLNHPFSRSLSNGPCLLYIFCSFPSPQILLSKLSPKKQFSSLSHLLPHNHDSSSSLSLSQLTSPEKKKRIFCYLFDTFCQNLGNVFISLINAAWSRLKCLQNQSQCMRCLRLKLIPGLLW